MLRVIAGDLRGRPLLTLSAAHVRPILARVKKSLFDILRLRVPGSRFLDLFAGTGPVGIEALSRGACFAAFVERDPQCLRLLKQNLERFHCVERASVFRLNAAGDLSILKDSFDLVFMGPPYKDEQKKPLALVTPTLRAIREGGFLAPQGLVVAQHHKKELVDLPAADWIRVREEKYGDTILTFIAPKR